MHLELRNLRHFVALMNHRSFVLAAQAVNLSQPAFSRSIQTLENQVGGKLVHRENKNLPPTRQGQMVLTYALEILGKADELGNRLGRFTDVQKGVLRFGAGPVAASALVPQALAELLDRYPDSSSQFVIDTWTGLNQRLISEEIDFFITNFLHFEKDPNYRIVHLKARPWRFYCRVGHPILNAKRLNRENLLEYPLACTLGVRGLVRQYLNQDDYAPNVLCDNGHAMLNIVLNSNAIGCSTQLPVIEALMNQAHGVKLLNMSDMPNAIASTLVRNAVVSLQREPLSPLADAFISMLVKVDNS